MIGSADSKLLENRWICSLSKEPCSYDDDNNNNNNKLSVSLLKCNIQAWTMHVLTPTAATHSDTRHIVKEGIYTA